MLYILVYTKYTQKTFLRILSIRRRPSGVYLAYAEGHHAHTKYKFEEVDDFERCKDEMLKGILGALNLQINFSFF